MRSRRPSTWAGKELLPGRNPTSFTAWMRAFGPRANRHRVRRPIGSPEPMRHHDRHESPQQVIEPCGNRQIFLPRTEENGPDHCDQALEGNGD